MADLNCTEELLSTAEVVVEAAILPVLAGLGVLGELEQPETWQKDYTVIFCQGQNYQSSLVNKAKYFNLSRLII